MADNFDNYGMKVQATASVKMPTASEIDKQIRNLEKSISKLQISGKLDDSSLKNLSHQLDTLKATVTTANFSPTALTELTNQVNRALQNINIGNINVGNIGNQAQQVGQQIGQQINQGVSQSLSGNTGVLDTFRRSLENIGMGSEEIDAVANRIENLGVKIEALNQSTSHTVGRRGNRDILSVDISGTDRLGQAIKLTEQYNMATGDLIRSMDSVSTAQQKATTNVSTFNDKLKIATSDYVNTLSKIESGINDKGVSKPIKDQNHIDALNTQIGEVNNAITNLGNASASTFTDMKIEVERQITLLQNMERAYRNAETVATSLRSKDIDTVKSQYASKLDVLTTKMKSSGVYTSGFEKGADNLQDMLQNATNSSGLVAFLNGLDKLDAGYKRAKASADAFNQAQKVGIKVSGLESSISDLQKISPEIDKFEADINGVKVTIKSLGEDLSKVSTQSDFSVVNEKWKAFTKAAEASGIAIRDFGNVTDSIAGKVKKIQLSFDNGHGDSEYKNRIQSLVNDFERYGLSVEEANKKTANLRTILDGFKVDGNFLTDDQLVAQADKLEAEFKAVKVSLDSAKLSYDKFLQPVSSEKASSLIIRINDFLSKNKNITAEAKEELLGFIRLLQSGNVNLSDWNKFDTRLKEINIEMREANRLGKTLKQTLIDGAKSFAQWTFSSGAVMEVWQGLKRVYNESLKINDVMTDLAMSTDLTASQMESVVDKYSNLGEKLNATTSEMIASGTEWIKQGQSIADTETLITSAMVLDKVGKLENAQATEYLTSTMKGYKVAVEDTMDIVDKLSAVDMASATNVGGLAEAMSQVANNANLAGVSMDKLLGYIAVIGETTGEGMSSVGTGLNAIFSRMGNIKLARLKDYQNNGEDLSNVETVLRGEGILLRDSANEFRNFGEVLDEVAGRWTSFSEVSQRAIASAFAGTHHMEQFMVLMEGYGKATEYTEKSLNSSGEAMQKFADYQESVTAHTELFNKSIQDLARTAVDSGLVNWFIDLGASSVKAADGLMEALTPLGMFSTIGGGILGAKNLG